MAVVGAVSVPFALLPLSGETDARQDNQQNNREVNFSVAHKKLLSLICSGGLHQ